MSVLRSWWLGVSLAVLSCSSRDEIGQVSSEIQSISANINVSQDSSNGYCETSGAVVNTITCGRTGCIPGANVVFAYNSQKNNFSQGWGVSYNGGAT